MRDFILTPLMVAQAFYNMVSCLKYICTFQPVKFIRHFALIGISPWIYEESGNSKNPNSVQCINFFAFSTSALSSAISVHRDLDWALPDIKLLEFMPKQISIDNASVLLAATLAGFAKAFSLSSDKKEEGHGK